MRSLAAMFLLVHGAAHTIGFLSPWGLAPRATNGAPPPALNSLFGGRIRLSDGLSRGLGIFWLVTALAFAVIAVAWWRRAAWSSPALVVIVVVSMLLSIVWWPVARFGVFINVAILGALGFGGYRQFSNDLTQARIATRSRALMVVTALGPIQYATLGAGDPVLVIHGTGGGWDQGLYAAESLATHGFQLIAPSRFGYLGTPMPARHSPADEADAFAMLLDSLGIQRAAVISYSAGAAPAMQFALRHPERASALVLMVPAAGGIAPPLTNGPPAFVMNVVLASNLPMWLALRHAPKTIADLAAVPYALLDSLSIADRAQYERGVQMLLPITERRLGMLNDARNQSGAEPLYPLADIRVSTLLVSAEDDLYRTAQVARVAATRIPKSKTIIVRNGGHFLLGHDAEIWPEVVRFMRAAQQ